MVRLLAGEYRKESVVMLCPERVTSIKLLLARGRTHKSITKKYRVSLGTVAAIARGEMHCRPNRVRIPAKNSLATNAAEPREMTKADICNVRLVHTDDLKELQDSLNEAVSGGDRSGLS